MSVLHGPKKDRLLEEFDHDIAVVSIDSLTWALKAGVFERVNPDVLIVDESSFVKNHQSLRFRLLRNLLHRFRRRIILTGTPSPNGAMDLWSQLFVVDRGGALEPYITRFRNRYFQDVGFTYADWKLMDGAFDKISTAIKPLIFRADDPEVRALMPDILLNEITVTLDGPTRAKYKALADDFFLMVDEGDLAEAADGVQRRGVRGQRGEERELHPARRETGGARLHRWGVERQTLACFLRVHCG